MGLKNLKVIYKINIISLITIILLGIVTFVLYPNPDIKIEPIKVT